MLSIGEAGALVEESGSLFVIETEVSIYAVKRNLRKLKFTCEGR